MKHDSTGRAQPRQPVSHEEHQPHGGWEMRPERAGSAFSRGTRSPLLGDLSTSTASRFGGELPCGTVNVASVPSPAGLQPIAIASNRNGVEPTKEPLPRLQQWQQQQQQQEENLQESHLRRFVVKAHKPGVPDDQKRSIKELQQLVIAKVSRIMDAVSVQDRSDFYGYDDYDFPASCSHSAEQRCGVEDGDIQAMKTEISGDISNAFRDMTATQNNKIFQAEGLLKEARRKIDILEKIIEEKDGKIEEGAAAAVTRDVDDAGQAAAITAALKGDVIRIKSSSGVATSENEEGDGAELIALKKSTLISHLMLVLDSRLRGNDAERTGSTAPTAAATGTGSEATRAVQVSEERADAAMGEATSGGAELRARASTVPPARPDVPAHSILAPIDPWGVVGAGAGAGADGGGIGGGASGIRSVAGQGDGGAADGRSSDATGVGSRGCGGGDRLGETEVKGGVGMRELSAWRGIGADIERLPGAPVAREGMMVAGMPKPSVAREGMRAGAPETLRRGSNNTPDHDGRIKQMDDRCTSGGTLSPAAVGGGGAGVGVHGSSMRGAGFGSEYQRRDDHHIQHQHQHQHQQQHLSHQQQHQRHPQQQQRHHERKPGMRKRFSTRKHADEDQWRGSAIGNTHPQRHSGRDNGGGGGGDGGGTDLIDSPASAYRVSTISPSGWTGDAGGGGNSETGGGGGGGGGGRMVGKGGGFGGGEGLLAPAAGSVSASGWGMERPEGSLSPGSPPPAEPSWA